LQIVGDVIGAPHDAIFEARARVAEEIFVDETGIAECAVKIVELVDLHVQRDQARIGPRPRRAGRSRHRARIAHCNAECELVRLILQLRKYTIDAQV
jgi:hypothetical protein